MHFRLPDQSGPRPKRTQNKAGKAALEHWRAGNPGHRKPEAVDPAQPDAHRPRTEKELNTVETQPRRCGNSAAPGNAPPRKCRTEPHPPDGNMSGYWDNSEKFGERPRSGQVCYLEPKGGLRRSAHELRKLHPVIAPDHFGALLSDHDAGRIGDRSRACGEARRFPERHRLPRLPRQSLPRQSLYCQSQSCDQERPIRPRADA
ncbi:hypothetical protein SAMN02745193_01457 [Erythrobacter sanguineus]|uniref:Uncharacterized protein n=1 Tax=Erythrobacter sanguineus TaxID=198312 RepID=A0A1M7SCU3_9SPHN|nr:hypothetical protein SAMN02745193_01457 [Erythrobacter sanguineus]